MEQESALQFKALLRETGQLYARRFWLLAGLTALVFALPDALQTAVSPMSLLHSPSPSFGVLFKYLLGLAASVAALLGAAVAQGGATAVAAARSGNLRSAMAAGRRHLPPLLGLSVLWFLAVSPVFVAIALLRGFIHSQAMAVGLVTGAASASVQAPFALAVPIIVLDGGGVIDGLRRSFALTRGYRLRIGLVLMGYDATWVVLHTAARDWFHPAVGQQPPVFVSRLSLYGRSG